MANPVTTAERQVTHAGETPLSAKELELLMHVLAGSNFLSVGMIYLKDNPLLKEPLKIEHVKRRLLGHWGASPALSFAWVHLNRMIVKHDLDMIFVAGQATVRPRIRSRVPGGHLLRDLSGQEPGCRRDAEVLQAVFVSRSHRQPRHARDARLDP